MATDKLCCETIGDLGNGQTRDIVNEQINRAVTDTFARGSDGKKRVVTIQIEMELDGETIIARAFALFKPPPFFAGASRGEVQEQRGGPVQLLFDLAESEAVA